MGDDDGDLCMWKEKERETHLRGRMKCDENLERRLIENRIQSLDTRHSTQSFSRHSGDRNPREGEKKQKKQNKQVLVKWLADCQLICTRSFL